MRWRSRSIHRRSGSDNALSRRSSATGTEVQRRWISRWTIQGGAGVEKDVSERGGGKEGEILR